MKIKLTSRCTWGGQYRKRGEVHDLEDGLAKKLIYRGYAEEYDPAADKAEENADQSE
jgi:hypothetical protein